MTKGYLVMWEVDIWADSPREAAEKARAMQLSGDSTATVFDVVEHDSAHMDHIDLMEKEDDCRKPLTTA